MLGNLVDSQYSRTLGDFSDDVRQRILDLLRIPGPPKSLRIDPECYSAAIQLHQSGRIADFELATLATLRAVQLKFPKLWFGGVDSDYDPNLPLANQFAKLRLRGVKRQALECIARWADGRISARLCCGEVTVSQLVAAQAKGFRYVGLSDDIEFISHDLCHAFRYFYPDESAKSIDDYHHGQRGFFVLIHQILPRLIAKGWVSDQPYDDERLLNHVITDMNGEGFYLHSALAAKVIEIIRREAMTTEDLRPTALEWIWNGLVPHEKIHQMIDPAHFAPVIAALMDLSRK